MTTIDTLRAALDQMADQAPPPSVIDHSAWLNETLPSKNRANPRRRRGLVGGCAAAAAVVTVATALTVTGHGQHTEPGVAVTPPAYGIALFGPTSMPGLELNSAVIGRRHQIYVYDTPGAPFVQLSFQLDVFVPDPAMNSALSHMAAVRIGTVPGRYGTSPATDPRSLPSLLYAPAPAGKYAGQAVPGVSVVAWPIDGTRWAAITPEYVHGPAQVLGRDELVARAATLVRNTNDRLAPVRVGYVPAGLQFTAAGAQPVSRSATAGVRTNRSGPGGMSGTAQRIVTFTTQPDTLDPDTAFASLAIEVLDGAPALTQVTDPADQLPSVYGTDWHKTTINGHLVWRSPRDILIQWGAVVVAVSTTSRTGHDAILSPAELLHVAESIQVPRPFDEPGLQLISALPATTLR